MKCLYITSKPIYPIVDGGCFAMDSFLKLLLASGITVDHIAISTQKHPFDAKAYPNNIPVSSVTIDTAIKPIQAIKYLVKKGAYNVERFHSDLVLEAIEEKVKGSGFDIIILDSLYSTTYLNAIRQFFKGKIFLRSHNCEAQIWYDLAENERNIPKSVYYKKLAKDLEKYECEVIQNVDGVLAISHEDLELFRKQHNEVNACVIPVHLPCERNDSDVTLNSIFHLGSMDWVPNVDAVNRLIKIFKKIRSSRPELSLHISGKNSDKLYTSDPEQNINIDGFVNDLQEYARKNGILVSPIASSSGVRIKILEMMSHGVPVITTEAGARGILPKGKSVIRIVNSNEEISKSILELSSDAEQLMRMKKDALDYIAEYHDIDKVSSLLKNFIGG